MNIKAVAKHYLVPLAFVVTAGAAVVGAGGLVHYYLLGSTPPPQPSQKIVGETVEQETAAPVGDDLTKRVMDRLAQSIVRYQYIQGIPPLEVRVRTGDSVGQLWYKDLGSFNDETDGNPGSVLMYGEHNFAGTLTGSFQINRPKFFTGVNAYVLHNYVKGEPLLRVCAPIAEGKDEAWNSLAASFKKGHIASQELTARIMNGATYDCDQFAQR